MSKLFALLILLCALLRGVLAVAQISREPDFNPEHQPEVALTTPDLTAVVVAQPPDPNTGQTRSIVLTSKAGRVTLPLSFDFAQVNSISRGPAGKLVVVGMPTGTVYVVGIIDTAAGKLIDTFTCYQPAISPDGRYVAFTKLFPPHSSPSPDDDSMIYDVAGGAAANRPAGVSPDEKIDVGFALYPWGIGTRANNINVPAKSAHLVAGDYLWRDSQYFFADRSGGNVHIVWVAIANGAATVRKLTLPQSDLVQIRDDFTLTNAELEGDEVKLTFHTNQDRTVVLSAADFVHLGSVDLRTPPTGAP